jgi:predicted O-methyltransferase YrrM
MKQRFTRIVWSNRLNLSFATIAVDLFYFFRRYLTGQMRTPKRYESKKKVPNDLAIFHRYKTDYESIGGWFSDNAIATWDALLTLQLTQNFDGNLMEIGVLRGKSAALLSLHARPSETCLFVDIAFRKEAIDIIESIRPKNNLFIKDMSQNIHNREDLQRLCFTFRWIHIDGEHSGHAVRSDLEIAEELLNENGVICLDDFMNPAYPQITMAVFSFLENRADAFTLFLNGFNKGYLCRTTVAHYYLNFIKTRMFEEFQRRGIENVTIWKTTAPDDLNCFGLTPKREGFDYKGPDWAPDQLPI